MCQAWTGVQGHTVLGREGQTNPRAPAGSPLLWHLQTGNKQGLSPEPGSSPARPLSSQPRSSGLQFPLCKVSIFPVLPTTEADCRALGVASLSVLPELDTQGPAIFPQFWRDPVFQQRTKGARAVRLREGKKCQYIFLSCAQVCVHTHTHGML